ERAVKRRCGRSTRWRSQPRASRAESGGGGSEQDLPDAGGDLFRIGGVAAGGEQVEERERFERRNESERLAGREAVDGVEDRRERRAAAGEKRADVQFE